MEPAKNYWRYSEKFFFRFFFILLGISTIICWDNLGDMLHRTFSTSPYDYGAFYGSLHAPFHWLDQHIFHTGYDPETQQPFPGDNHFGILFCLVLLIISIIAAVVWSILDSKRRNYDRLNYWFSVYLRYMLAITMFCYGIDKLIPVQMAYPNIESLLRPLGLSTRFAVFWNFMGISPGYMILTGAVEVVGALLLFSRRTIALGSIVTLSVLINVVSLNVFYNVVVKLFSMQLLIYTLYLLYPYGYRLMQLFFGGQSVSLTSSHYRFQAGWKKYIMKTILVCLPILILTTIGVGIIHRYQRNKRNIGLEKDYEVATFIAKDTLAALQTDTLRWKRFLISYSNYMPHPYAVVWDMQDNLDHYYCEMDTTKKIFTLKEGGDTLQKHVFNYSNPTKTQLLLSGKWKGKDVQILMNDVPIDSLWLNKETIKLIGD